MYLVAACTDDVDAVIERAKAERRRPRVVEDDERAAPVRDLGDRGNVLHLERQRSGRLGEHERVFGRNSRSIAAPASGS